MRGEAEGVDAGLDEEHTIDLDDAAGADPASPMLGGEERDRDDRDEGTDEVVEQVVRDKEFQGDENMDAETSLGSVNGRKSRGSFGGEKHTGPARFSGLFASDSDSE